MMRKRLALAGALVVGLLTLSTGRPVSPETADRLVRMQVRVTTSSDWTSVAFDRLDLRARRTVSATATQVVWDAMRGWTVVPAHGPTEAAVVVIDVIAELHGDDIPRLTVGKGREGTARVEVLATNGVEPTPAADLLLDTHDPYRNTLSQDVRREALLAQPLVLPEVDDRNLALAFYYPWFRSDAQWDPKVNPDKPGSWFATDDRQHVRGMVAEAAGAGLDGFIVSWEGPVHGEVVGRLMDEVRERPGFVVSPLLELKAMRTRTLLGDRFDPEAAAQALADFERRVPSTARLRIGDRPVVVTFGMWDLQPSEWAAFLARVAPLRPFIIGDRAEPGFAVDGLYHYDPNPRSVDELAVTYDRSLDRTRLQPALDPSQRQLLWAATVSPGFDNRASTLLLGARWTDRGFGWRYDQTWRVALDAQPEWVFVTSWNEWFEQTHIAPGRTTGRTALDQTAAWATRFHSSSP